MNGTGWPLECPNARGHSGGPLVVWLGSGSRHRYAPPCRRAGVCVGGGGGEGLDGSAQSFAAAGPEREVRQGSGRPRAPKRLGPPRRLGGPSRRARAARARDSLPRACPQLPSPHCLLRVVCFQPPAQSPLPCLGPPPLSLAAPSRDFSTLG